MKVVVEGRNNGFVVEETQNEYIIRVSKLLKTLRPLPKIGHRGIVVNYTKNFWTSEQDEILINAEKNGLTIQDIAKKTNRTKASCYGRMKALRKKGKDVPRRLTRVPIKEDDVYHWTPMLEQSLIRMRNEGMTIKSIAQAIGRTTEACRSKLKKIKSER